MSPLARHQQPAGPWVPYAIVPLFALADAGVRVTGGQLPNPLTDRVAPAPAVGLVLGKAVGVLGATALAVRVGIVRLPRDVSWAMMAGLAATGGIGFTVALFIANLSFEDPDVLARAKLGVLSGSIAAGAIGATALRATIRQAQARPDGDGASPSPRGAVVGLAAPRSH